ncbi:MULTISPECIES: hypothetical protein [unclassified Pseudomonas]|uniref:hypothetical protein n=1 Tax=unclassified Pseudomonas TaxID=196821 RepID=UPI0007EC3DE4|nr:MULTISPECIES: hypothetical protein [unclassified Pseudomonas]OBP11388.1 hypothetical protein BAE52_09765 [Pseudomonas sp. EGD-AKN5]QOF85453.1 hypothetical protein IG194_01655 [Pseudomonas sp. ADPe]
MSKEQDKSDACDWLENLEGDAWADACEEIAAAVNQQKTEQAEGAQGEQTSLRRALEQAYMALIGYLPAHRNAITDAAIEAARAALAQPSPMPELQGGLDVADDRPEFERQFNMTGWHIDESYRSGSSYKYQEQRMAFDAWKIARAALAQPSQIRCQCCGYLVTDSEHRSCLRAAQQPSPAPELAVLERWGSSYEAFSPDLVRQDTGRYVKFVDAERIVGALREKIDGAESQAEYQTRRAEHFAKERDAVLSRLAELEKQAPVTAVSEETFSADGTSDIITRNLPIGTMLYAAPVAQAGQVPEGYMLITQDQVERHATTAWECPPQSRVVLVSTLKRLHEKNSAVPQPAGGADHE